MLPPRASNPSSRFVHINNVFSLRDFVLSQSSVVIVKLLFNLCFGVGMESCMSNWLRLNRIEYLMIM